MPEFVVAVMHDDPMGEERCLLRFIWEGKNDCEVRGRAQQIREQLLAEAGDVGDIDLEDDRDDIFITVAPLDVFLGVYRERGVLKEELRVAAQQYAFVKEGATVFWEDPDGGSCSGPRVVKQCSYYYNDDSTVLLSELDGSGETEAYYSELTPKET